MDFFLASLVSLFITTASAQATNEKPGDAVRVSPPAATSKTDNVPAGGCMPIGLTARGEFVFPMTCQEVLGRPSGLLSSDQPPATAPPAVLDGKQQKTSRSEPEGTVPVVPTTPPAAPFVTGSVEQPAAAGAPERPLSRAERRKLARAQTGVKKRAPVAAQPAPEVTGSTAKR